MTMRDQDTGLTVNQRRWLEQIRECERSGETMKGYAEARGIPVTTLYSWKKKLKQKGVLADRPSGFERVVIADGARPANEWRVALPNGVEVAWTGPVDERSLAAVLHAALGVA